MFNCFIVQLLKYNASNMGIKYLQLNDIDAYKTAFNLSKYNHPAVLRGHKPKIESLSIEQYSNRTIIIVL